MNKQQLFALIDKYKAWVDYADENGVSIDYGALSEQIKEQSELIGKQAKKNPQEPDALDEIFALAPKAAFEKKKTENYNSKIRGALLGRFAGCILGAPVEGWQIEGMSTYAQVVGDNFPPTDYWSDVINPENVQYERSKRYEFTRDKMDGVPADDDVMYPLLNLMLMEKYGKNFTVKEVGEHWLENMTVCCTAEYEALENLKKGVSADKCAEDNPYIEWLGAEIRADAFGYAAPGDIYSAAKMAYNDAYLSHRRNGIYGEMYFAAVIASAFTANSIEEALFDGLKVIPEHCKLAEDIRWALQKAPEIADYLAARKAVDERMPGMFWVHTRNNTCLIIFALMLAGDDYTRLISQCVAMGHDNDCTTATAGSIFGAFYGIEKIPEYWYKNFKDNIKCFLKHNKDFSINDVIERFKALAEQ